MAPKSNDKCTSGREDRHRGEDHVKMQPGMGVMQPGVRAVLELPELGDARDDSPLGSWEGRQT